MKSLRMEAVEQYFPVVLFNFTVQLWSLWIRSEVGASTASDDSSPSLLFGGSVFLRIVSKQNMGI